MPEPKPTSSDATSRHFPQGGIEPDFEKVESSFERFIRSKGLKLTSQRRRVLKKVFSIHRHFTAEEVHQVFMRSRNPVSRATVYRTLSLLVEGGFLDSLDLGGERKFYEHILGHDHHDHIICLGCNEIIEFQEPRIEALQREVVAEHGYEIASHTLKLFGYCRRCQEPEEESDEAPPPPR